MHPFLRRTALFAFHVLFVRPVLRWVVGARYRRKTLVPEHACLVVANHNSHLDAAVLMSLFPLKRLPHVHPVAAADYFGATVFRRTLAMALMNGIPIERKKRPGSDPLERVREMLRVGETLIFFPEGSRGEAGVVAPFRPGVGRLVQSMPNLMVLPVFLSGPERIWPRGEPIPVPLTVEVHVGKPRTYDPRMDARKIASKVREDVLALAPPPPPPPAPRPGPPVRIAVCGMDAEAREATFKDLTRRFGERGTTAGLGRKTLEAEPEGVRPAGRFVPTVRSRAWLAVLAWVFRVGGLYTGSKFAEMIERARIDESFDHGGKVRYVVTDGSPLADLMAWAEAVFYHGKIGNQDRRRLMLYLTGDRQLRGRRWRRFLREMPEIWLINVLNLARLRVPDVLVLLASSPSEVAFRGKGRRGERLSPETLAGLQDAYREAAELMRRRRKTRVLEFDAREATAGEIADRVLETV